jgi:biotin carboxylase
VLTVDNKPDNPGHALAHASFNCDTTDVPTLVALAREQNVDGVVAAATDVALDAAAAIAETLGLPGPPLNCVHTLTRKPAFRALQKQLGLPHPRYTTVRDEMDFPPPWIVKPNRASGSKGIRIVEHVDELADAWLAAAAESKDGLALVEGFALGHQGTIEGVMANGRIAASLVTDRLTATAPWVATRRHQVPATLPRSSSNALHAQIEQIFDELGYKNGPFDGDFLVQNDGTPMLIELTPRAGGNSLVRLLQFSVGFDMPAYVIAAALGRAVPPDPFVPRPTIVEILGVPAKGHLAYDAEEVARLMSESAVDYLSMDLPPGSLVHSFIDGRHRVGELVVSANTVQQLKSTLHDVHRRIALGVN